MCDSSPGIGGGGVGGIFQAAPWVRRFPLEGGQCEELWNDALVAEVIDDLWQ